MPFWSHLSFLFNSHPHEEDDGQMQLSDFMEMNFQLTSSRGGWLLETVPLVPAHFFNSHPHEEDDDWIYRIFECSNFSTHILTRRMTAILNKIFSFKIKLYIHYNILFAIFYIYNSILYPFSSQKYSYSGANDSANSCSLAFRTPSFPVPSLQIHFP